MVFNVGAGWGTFPAFMQFPFFHYVSYLLPFTYMMHIQGAIAYGIGTGTHVFANSMYILQNIGILLIYPAIFIPLGLFFSRFRERELYYGTASNKKLAVALHKLNLSKYLNAKGKVD
jgi:putative membrane protein